MAINHATNTLCHRLLDSRKLLFLATTKNGPVGRWAGHLSTCLGITLAKKVKDIFFIVQSLSGLANTSHFCATH